MAVAAIGMGGTAIVTAGVIITAWLNSPNRKGVTENVQRAEAQEEHEKTYVAQLKFKDEQIAELKEDLAECRAEKGSGR